MRWLSGIFLWALLCCPGLSCPGMVWAQDEGGSDYTLLEEEKDIIEEDRAALQEALATGRSTKIMEARKQLSDDLARFAKRRRTSLDDIVVPLIPDYEGHFFVEVLINNHVPALLMVDTGAPVVLLSSRFVKKLGVDADRSVKGYMTILNGQHISAQVALRSLKLGRAEQRNVPAAVLLHSNVELEDKFRDGLLGLSFLKGYHYTIDHNKQRLILRRAK